LWITRAEGPKIGAKRPGGGTVFFPLDSGADFGESRSCDRTSFPRFTPDCTARHWRAFAVSGLG